MRFINLYTFLCLIMTVSVTASFLSIRSKSKTDLYEKFQVGSYFDIDGMSYIITDKLNHILIVRTFKDPALSINLDNELPETITNLEVKQMTLEDRQLMITSIPQKSIKLKSSPKFKINQVIKIIYPGNFNNNKLGMIRNYYNSQDGIQYDVQIAGEIKGHYDYITITGLSETEMELPK